jgi:hypothetical protein
MIYAVLLLVIAGQLTWILALLADREDWRDLAEQYFDELDEITSVVGEPRRATCTSVGGVFVPMREYVPIMGAYEDERGF